MNRNKFVKLLSIGTGIGLVTPPAIFIAIIFMISFDKAQVETTQEACQFMAVRIVAIQPMCDQMKKRPLRVFRNPFIFNK